MIDQIDLVAIKNENNGYYEVTDPDLSQALLEGTMDPLLPISFPKFSKSEIRLVHRALAELSSTKISRDGSTKERLDRGRSENDEGMSKILRDEMLGLSNMITSEDKDDILQTIRILNDTYINSHHHFLKLVNREARSEGRSAPAGSSAPLQANGGLLLDF